MKNQYVQLSLVLPDNNRPRKLTAQCVTEIRQLREEGMKYQAIAARFGLSVSTVYRICNGSLWRSVL